MQLFHDGIVGQHALGSFVIDQLADAVAHRFRRVRFAAVRASEEKVARSIPIGPDGLDEVRLTRREGEL